MYLDSIYNFNKSDIVDCLSCIVKLTDINLIDLNFKRPFSQNGWWVVGGGALGANGPKLPTLQACSGTCIIDPPLPKDHLSYIRK